MSQQRSKRSTARTTTFLGLFGLFVVAVLVVIARRALPAGTIHRLEERVRNLR